METFWKIVTSEFLWGIVVGLLVSFAGGWFQAHVTQLRQRQERKGLIKDFCIDLIRNLERYAIEISRVRKHGNSVPRRILGLIDNELIAYGRQRDFLFVIEQSAREEFRELMNDIAIKRAEVQFKLDQVEDIFAKARALDAAGDATKAKRTMDSVEAPMKELNSEADNLVSIINKGAGIVAKLTTSHS